MPYMDPMRNGNLMVWVGGLGFENWVSPDKNPFQ